MENRVCQAHFFRLFRGSREGCWGCPATLVPLHNATKNLAVKSLTGSDLGLVVSAGTSRNHRQNIWRGLEVLSSFVDVVILGVGIFTGAEVNKFG